MEALLSLLVLSLISTQQWSASGGPVDGSAVMEASGFLGSYVTLDCPVNLTLGDELEWSDTVYNDRQKPVVLYSSIWGLNPAHPNLEYVTVQDTKLTLDGLKSDDTGMYICNVHRTDGTSQRFTFELNLYTKPVCEGTEGSVPEGAPITLRCSTYMSAMQFPEIHWRNSRGRLRSYDVSDIIAAGHEVRLHASHTDDREQYTCVVSIENDGATEEETCHIQFRVTYDARNATVEPNQERYSPGDTLTFRIRGNPLPKVTLKLGVKAIGALKGDGEISVNITKDMLNKEFTYIFTGENKLSRQPVRMLKTFTVKARPCSTPEDIDNARYTVVGGAAIYNCLPGFYMATNTSHRLCEVDGSWVGELPRCQRLNCGDPGDITGAIKSGGYLYGQEVTYTAHVGFLQVSGDDRLTCQTDRTWKGTKPTFERVSCGDPGEVDFAHRSQRTLFGDTVYFRCHCGFEMTSGDHALICTASGLWRGTKPKCTEIPTWSPPGTGSAAQPFEFDQSANITDEA